MPPINGTAVCLYYNGQMIAMQKGLTVGLDSDLFDSTNKESEGWAEHGQGLMNAKIDFTSLFSTGLMTDTPKVLSAKDLMDFIINSSSILVSILGGPFPIIGKADMSSISFDAPAEQAMTLSGSLKINGPLYPLTELPAGKYINLITDPDAGGTSYNITSIVSGISVDMACSAGGGSLMSNVISVANTGVYRMIVFISERTGQLPVVGIWDNTSAYISNQVDLIDGLNFITLTVTATDASASFKFLNTGAASWKTSPIYLFRI